MYLSRRQIIVQVKLITELIYKYFRWFIFSGYYIRFMKYRHSNNMCVIFRNVSNFQDTSKNVRGPWKEDERKEENGN